MLLVPSNTKNLLSISKLTSDNLYLLNSVEMFILWRAWRGKFFCRALLKKGLYKLLLNSNSLSLSPTSHLYQSQLNKLIAMLSVLKNCDNFTKVCYHSISNKCNAKPDKITLLHRKFGHPSSMTLMHLLKSCKQFKVSQKDILSSASSLCEACQLGKVHKQHFSTTETKTKRC